ncbi:MAG: D-alanine--D-alanine ligase A [Candidatus Harrisonbacteria bacterium CG10_big_fil_rev_8_21_14_0_10_44_23]|uniref:D-alanine--D-alanine ligase n=1 Tax=Candidatus Harrisonbacteria bacterium CG10_big_fil_rev_8_21_14_0_10_44_23 TaxID=1974585 RepID=A0A2H0UQX8_9BACT|nr:MAG: D-alanine--D-alanine ligase A [Candidatus Harrisonbacteria bacterium CG10_big_fil_rev_8_21_14_0_10_44_23]
MQKTRIGIIFGGKSAEHEVSVQSAENVVAALDKSRYEPVLVFVDKGGNWFLRNGEDAPLTIASCDLSSVFDVAFPLIHGPFGEDGTLQGFLKMANVPFVGAGVLGSAVGMDKDVMKRLLVEAGMEVGKYLTIRESDKLDYGEVVNKLGEVVFIKPANLGSSVGISRVTNEAEYSAALSLAFSFDRKVVVEANIDGREIECAVLGNNRPMASVPGEIITKKDFYSYEAKYIDEDGARLEIPAKLEVDKMKEVQTLAVKVFKTLECEGMGRVDMFLAADGRLLVNEINTIPGFTKISMYPKLWEVSGISYSDLINRLIKLAIERFDRENNKINNNL